MPNCTNIINCCYTSTYPIRVSGIGFVAGNIMSTYTQDYQHNGNRDIYLSEVELYGSSRIGLKLIDKKVSELSSPSPNLFYRGLGLKRYEISNHLGNVLTTFTDQKKEIQGTYTVTDYAANIKSSQDYYPFGMIMNGRNYNTSEYKFGFNGKENDNEVKGIGNQQDYGMRIYDNRSCRFLSVDPLTHKYPWYTPYQFAGNTPIQAIDLDGLEPWNVTGQEIKTTNYSNGSSVTTNKSFSGTVYGPWKDQDAASQAAVSGTIPISNFSFTNQSSTTKNSGFNGSITDITNTTISGYYSEFNMNGVNFANGIESGNNNFVNKTTEFYIFLNGRSTGSGDCYSTGVVEALTENFVRQPIQLGLEELGMSENAAYWTSSGLTLAGSIVVGKVATKSSKGSLSSTKIALSKAKSKIGLEPNESLPKSQGKFGSPQRGTPIRGYRLDPPHPNAVIGSGEEFPHINYWDYTSGKRGSGGISGAEPIID